MPTLRPLSVTSCCAALIASAAIAQTRAEFQFEYAAGAETAQVAVRYSGCEGTSMTVAMPAWKPGSYTIRNFGQNLRDLVAVNADGRSLEVVPVDQNTWRVATEGAAVVDLRYALTTRPSTGMGSSYSVGKGLGKPTRTELEDGSKGPPIWPCYEFEGPATWCYVPEHLAIPHTVSFTLPAEWRVATGMPATAADGLHFGADDYDVFADCPFHLGVFESRSFEVDATRYTVVWSGFEHDGNDRDAFAARYRQLARAHHAMWGGAPFDHYVFLIGFPGGGGLEHLFSTNIGMMDLSGSVEDRASGWDSLSSHEFFHAWNVKRLRPAALGPFDYGGPNRTRYLWLSEGVTSYYGDLQLVRAGIWSATHFWEDSIQSEIRSLQANPGRKKLSIAEASWTVWDFPYMRRGLTAPDYYNKGMLLGLLLDIEIRDATDGAKSLDDVMRALLAQCMQSGQGFADGDVRKSCETVSGRSFESFFADYVEGTVELPFVDTLAKVGIEVTAPMPRAAANEEPATGGETARPAGPARRSTNWRVRMLDDAPERALRLREAMTARLVQD